MIDFDAWDVALAAVGWATNGTPVVVEVHPTGIQAHSSKSPLVTFGRADVYYTMTGPGISSKRFTIPYARYSFEIIDESNIVTVGREDGLVVKRLNVDTGQVTRLCTIPDGEFGPPMIICSQGCAAVAYSTIDGVRVVSTVDQSQTQFLSGFRVNEIAFSRDERSITAKTEMSIPDEVWKLREGELLPRIREMVRERRVSRADPKQLRVLFLSVDRATGEVARIEKTDIDPRAYNYGFDDRSYHRQYWFVPSYWSREAPMAFDYKPDGYGRIPVKTRPRGNQWGFIYSPDRKLAGFFVDGSGNLAWVDTRTLQTAGSYRLKARKWWWGWGAFERKVPR